jgi:hypothetical protein
MRKVAAAQCTEKERQGVVVMCCVFAERSVLSFIAT